MANNEIDLTKRGEALELCLKYASQVQCVKVHIYNAIREVGYGKMFADQALHQFIEDYKNLGDIGEGLSELADKIGAIGTKEAGNGKGA